MTDRQRGQRRTSSIPMTLTLYLGAMADPISDQLDAGGFGGTEVQRKFWQRQADCITHLAIHGTLADAEVGRARRRLLKRIAEAVVPR